MQYPYLTFLEAITMILALFIGIVILYFLIRIFNKTIKLLTVLKAILLYELFAIIVYSIYPEPMFSSLKFLVLKLVVLSTILFLIFYFITRKYFLVDWKKSLVLFFLISFILFPLLDYFRVNLEFKLMNLSVFAEESSRWGEQIKQEIEGRGGFFFYIFSFFSGKSYEPLSFKILGKIEGGMFSWPGNCLRQIIIQIGNKSLEEKTEYYVKVISPNGSEKIEADQPLKVEWDSKNIGSVKVSLLSSNDISFEDVYVSRVCSKTDASLGSCQGILKDFHIAPYYKIKIEGYREKPSEELSYVVASDESDNYFTIAVDETANWKTYQSPDGVLRAQIIPVGKTQESRVQIRTNEGVLLREADYSSEDGDHGLRVILAEWTPNSQFFIYSAASSGGHQPWFSRVYFYNRSDNKIYYFTEVSGFTVANNEFTVTAPDIVTFTVYTSVGMGPTATKSFKLNDVISK